MKLQPSAVFLLSMMLMPAIVYATPVLHDNIPENNTFIRGGTKLFSINATSSQLDQNKVALHIISQDALQSGENWDIHLLSCVNSGNEWNCSKSLSFAIAGSDTIEYFYFRGNDTDNTSATSGTAENPFVISLDRNSPSISFVIPENNSYVKGNQTIKITATDATSGVDNNTVQYSFDNSIWTILKNTSVSTFQGNFSTTSYSNNQTLTIYLKGSDRVGNNANKSINVTVDNEVPTLLILSPNATVYGSYIQLIVNVSDAYSGIDKVSYSAGSIEGFLGCTADNHNSTCSSVLNAAQLGNGNHTITFVATDKAGNPRSGSVNVTVDNTKPGITITSPSQNSYLKGNVTITASVSNGKNFVQYVTVTLQGGGISFTENMTCDANITSCQYVLDTTKYSDNSYTLKTTAVNTLGTDVTSSMSVTLDNKAPSVSIFHPTGSNVAGTFKIEYSVDDEIAVNGNSGSFKIGNNNYGISCSVQLPGRVMICSTNFDSSQIPEGSYTLLVTGRDLAGNTGSASKQITITKSGGSSGTGGSGSSGTSGESSGSGSSGGSSAADQANKTSPFDFFKSLNIPFGNQILFGGVLVFVALVVVGIVIFVRRSIKQNIITD